MTTKHDLVIRKLSFILDGAQRTYTVDDEAIRAGCFLESLLAAPSHVLKYDPSSLGNQYKISQAMNDNAPVTPLDDTRKHSESRRQTAIPVGEDVNVRALGPGLVDRGVNSFLHILSVEVNRGLRFEKRSRETKNIPRSRIHVENPVDIERRVDRNCSIKDFRPDIASGVSLDAFSR